MAMKEQLLNGIQLSFSAKPVLVKLVEMLDEETCLTAPSGEQLFVVDMILSSSSGEFSFSTKDVGLTEDINADFYQPESAEEGPFSTLE